MPEEQEPRRAMSRDEIDNLFNGEDDALEKLGEEAEETEQLAQEPGEAAAPEESSGDSAEQGDEGENVSPVQFGQLSSVEGTTGKSNIDLLLDVKLPITVELGRSSLRVKEILEFGPGSIIELNKSANEPVDLLVNGVLVARGEVVVVDDHFGVRLTSLISPEERIRSLGGAA